MLDVTLEDLFRRSSYSTRDSRSAADKFFRRVKSLERVGDPTKRLLFLLTALLSNFGDVYQSLKQYRKRAEQGSKAAWLLGKSDDLKELEELAEILRSYADLASATMLAILSST